MKQENAIIDKVRKYIAKCPYLKEYAESLYNDDDLVIAKEKYSFAPS